LETLEEMKLVHRGYNAREFRLTDGVKRLAQAKGVYEELRRASWPVLEELTARHIWPSDLAVFHDNSMLIIESTHRLSPLSSDIGMIGRSRSMMLSPLGRAYLSHCEQEQRDSILAHMREHPNLTDGVLADNEVIQCIIDQGRKDGYSMCPDLPHARCASIAVPIRAGQAVIATMNMVWNVTEMSFEQVPIQLGEPLKAARNSIERRLQEITDERRAEQAPCPAFVAPFGQGGMRSHPLIAHHP
tara:strand:+ start:18031 stop:18762 length:732 start_codon:yes stop_codon:yes gene_type:complete